MITAHHPQLEWVCKTHRPPFFQDPWPGPNFCVFIKSLADISPKIKTMCLPANRCHPTGSVTPTHPSAQAQTNISSAVCAHLLDSESMHIAATSQHPFTQTPTLKHPVNLPPHRDSGYFEEDSKVDCDLYCRERSPPPLPHLLG